MGDLQQASPIPANIPKGVVTDWSVDDVRNWLSQSMQLPQYLEPFEGISSPNLSFSALCFTPETFRLRGGSDQGALADRAV
jgi:hypothetical protein